MENKPAVKIAVQMEILEVDHSAVVIWEVSGVHSNW